MPDETKALMTETDALAYAIAVPLDEQKAFNAEVAEKACNRLADLREAGRIDKATFARVNARIGNHSAMRQWGVKQGFISMKEAKEDALCIAVRKILAEVDAALPQ